MSQRNRIVRVAIVVAAAIVLVAPVSSFAAGLPAGKVPQAGVWEQAWSWLASVVYPGDGILRVLPSRWEKEGGAVDPNGSKTAAAPVPLKPLSPSVGGL